MYNYTAVLLLSEITAFKLS